MHLINANEQQQMSSNNNKIRCLMIGQIGIGKSAFLRSFPDSTQLTNATETKNKETFKYNCINAKQIGSKKYPTTNTEPETSSASSAYNKYNYDNLDIEIDNYDMHTDTYLNTTDIGELQFSDTASIIDASTFKVVILAFNMDDANSFEMIRTKWETDLKKNSKYSFILLGLKSENSVLDKSNKKDDNSGVDELHVATTNTEEISLSMPAAPLDLKKKKLSGRLKKSSSFAYKKRSCSINSNSSTSKLKMQRQSSFSETEVAVVLPRKIYKSFAKQIAAASFIESTSLDILSTKSIETYTQFAQSICSIFNNTQFLSSNKSITKLEPVPSKTDKSIKDRIPKSLSAPINYLVNRKKNKIPTPSASFVKLDNNDVNLTVLKVENENQSSEQLPISDENSVTMKEKFSRLFLGLGTYIVTCGSAQSKKLVIANRINNMKNSRNTNDLSHHAGQFVDKSWLLLSSHNSLNSLDEVFATAST